jgi:Bacterial SH3 domain
LTKEAIALAIKRSEIIDTSYDALYFSNANGTDIYINPGFVMMPSQSKDFALIDVRELQAKCSESDYIEEKGVPGDTAIIGYTWKKANKDGSRDRRFANNYQLPIVKYAEIEFRSPTGLHEIYQFSNYTAAATFVESLSEYQTTLAALAERSKDHSANPLLTSSGDDSEETEAEAAEATTAAPQALQPKPARFLIFDRLAFVILIAFLVGTGLYFGLDFGRIQETYPVAQPRASAATPALVPPIPPTPAASPPTPTASPPTPAASRPSPAATPSKPAATPPSAAQATAPPPPIESVYVLRPRVNVRSEPSSASQVLSTVTLGTRLTVFQRQGEWSQIGEGGPIGWVHQSLLGTAPPP